MRNGYGIRTDEDGTTFKGYWQDGRRHGEGMLICPGRIGTNEIWFVKGIWEHNNLSGYGEAGWYDGKLYQGNFINNVRSGLGTWIYPGGNGQTGETRPGDKFVAHKKIKSSVRIEMYEEYTHIYYGEFKGKRRHGYGWYYCDEFTYEGQWLNGKRHGQGIESNHIYTYEGQFDQNNPAGKGIMTFTGVTPADARTTGWRKNWPDWLGHEGDTYKGDFGNGRRKGFGVYSRKDGSIVFEGEWDNGSPVDPPEELRF